MKNKFNNGYYRLGELINIQTGNMNAQDSEKMGMYDFYIRSQEKLKSNFYTFEGDAIIFPGEGIFLPH